MTILPSIQKNCHVEKKERYNKDLGSLIADIFINRTGDFRILVMITFLAGILVYLF